MPDFASLRAPAGGDGCDDVSRFGEMSAGRPLPAAERERRFKSAFVDAADAMFIIDRDRRIVEANRAAAATYEMPIERLAGCRLDDLLIDDDDSLASAWRELVAFGEAKRDYRTATRAARVLECSLRAARHDDRYLCIARDVTNRRAIEARLAHSERIESVARLAGGIAHDFNNLLTAILGYTELLLSNCASNDAARADLQEIQRAGQRAAALTHQLLAYSRKQVLLPKDVDLNTTVAGLKSMLTRLIREDITLVCELAPTPAVVRIDPGQLEQIIINLVINARDALPSGGVIRIEVARARLAEVDVPSDQPVHAPNYVRLRVVDNGIGIAPHIRPHLFEPFFTTKELGKGTGLGLASVYGIVRQSNGFISVESEPGRGAAFTMHFPAVGPADAVPEADATEAAAERPTVLLVEDEDAVRLIVKAVLDRHGYRVLEAATPAAACELFDRHPAGIDLLLSDVVMPGMNGPALAQRLIGVKPGLKVLFISGYSDVALPLDANSNMSFLSKPFQASVLIARIRQMLGPAARPGLP